MRATVLSPQHSLALLEDRARAIVRFTCAESDWVDAAREALAEARADLLTIAQPVSISTLTDAHGDENGLEVTYANRPHDIVPGRTTWIGDVIAAYAGVASGLAALHAAGATRAFGPFPPRLVRWDGHHGQLIAAGVWAVAYARDSGTRGPSTIPRHFIESSESLRGQPLTSATDAYHVAYALFWALTGHEPFPTANTTSYSTAVQTGARAELAQLRPDVPAPVGALIEAALASDPGDRPSLEMLAAGLPAVWQETCATAQAARPPTLTDWSRAPWLRPVELGTLAFATSAVAAQDVFSVDYVGEFRRYVEPGRYPVTVFVPREPADARVLEPEVAIIRFAPAEVARWELAATFSEDLSALPLGHVVGCRVDSCKLMVGDEDAIVSALDEMSRLAAALNAAPACAALARVEDGEVALFGVGSDGLYPLWWGLDEHNEVACLVIPLGGAYEQPR